MSQAAGIFAEHIDIYIGFSVGMTYDFLLFSLALWAAIQCSKQCSPTTRNGAQHIRILLEGNMIYFHG